jgi:glycosyltransferase involved in cell wall biosynthesis
VQRWAGSERFEPDLVWMYSPYELALLDRFPHARSVYWTGDEVVMPGEEELLRRVDAILCVSTPVYERHLARYGARVHFVPVACDFDRYHAALGQGAAELPDLQRPVVGYSGFVNARVDTALVADVARSLGGEGTVVVVGPVAEAQRRELARTPIVLIGPQPPERVPRLIDAFDAAVIPYTDSDFNHNANPAKFYEYLALGKPVVSTDIPTLRRFGDVASIGSRESFVDRIHAVLDHRDDRAEARIAIARDHSFDALLDRLRALPE